jgi:hypothetical protein
MWCQIKDDRLGEKGTYNREHKIIPKLYETRWTSREDTIACLFDIISIGELF